MSFINSKGNQMTTFAIVMIFIVLGFVIGDFLEISNQNYLSLVEEGETYLDWDMMDEMEIDLLDGFIDTETDAVMDTTFSEDTEWSVYYEEMIVTQEYSKLTTETTTVHHTTNIARVKELENTNNQPIDLQAFLDQFYASAANNDRALTVEEWLSSEDSWSDSYMVA